MDLVGPLQKGAPAVGDHRFDAALDSEAFVVSGPEGRNLPLAAVA